MRGPLTCKVVGELLIVVHDLVRPRGTVDATRYFARPRETRRSRRSPWIGGLRARVREVAPRTGHRAWGTSAALGCHGWSLSKWSTRPSGQPRFQDGREEKGVGQNIRISSSPYGALVKDGGRPNARLRVLSQMKAEL